MAASFSIRRLVGVLRENRSFRTLYAANAVSQMGDWFNVVALFSLLLELTGKGEAVAFALLTRFVPMRVTKVSRIDTDGARQKVHDLLLTGDNRLKQGVSAEKVRQSYEQALAAAREAGLEDAVRPLVEVRLADLERLARGSPRSGQPGS